MPIRKFTDKEEQLIVQQYLTPLLDGTWLGATTLAKQWGTNHRTIYSVLKRQNAPTRDAKAAHANGKQCKPIRNIAPINEVAPLCLCGCGEQVNWSHRRNTWERYQTGHRGNPPYKTTEWLFDNYITKRRGAVEIASQFNVSSTTIYRYLEDLGISRRDASLSKAGIFKGEKNPAWRGGVTPLRQKLYKSMLWKKTVKAVYQRDNYLCVRCGTSKLKKVQFHAHHIKLFATHPTLRFDLANLVTLCDSCHRWVHSNANVHKEFLSS